MPSKYEVRRRLNKCIDDIRMQSRDLLNHPLPQDIMNKDGLTAIANNLPQINIDEHINKCKDGSDFLTYFAKLLNLESCRRRLERDYKALERKEIQKERKRALELESTSSLEKKIKKPYGIYYFTTLAFSKICFNFIIK